MSYTEYTTHDMLQLVRVTREPDLFWLQNFFPQQMNYDGEWIDFDVIDEGQRLAPFVAPTAQGKVVKKDGYFTRRFKPAYVKPKLVVDPSQLVPRRAGEPYTGSLTLAQRRDAIIAENTRKLQNQIRRRWNWMAAQATLYGQVTVEGENYPQVVVDFGRDPSLTVVKTGTALWTDPASTPQEDMENGMRNMRAISGYSSLDAVMGSAAWAAYRRHPSTLELLETRRGSTSTLELGPGKGDTLVNKGQIGDFNIWVYSDKYENDAGVQTDYMDPRDVVFVASAGFQGVRCFGAIMDKRAGYRPVDIFAKIWEQEDPSVEFVLLQSAPLMVPKQPNASMRMRVVS